MIIFIEPFKCRIRFLPSRESFSEKHQWESEGLDRPQLDLRDADGCCSDFGRLILIGVFDGRIETLVHEVGHASIKVMANCGVPVNEHTQEVFCLLQEFILRSVLAGPGRVKNIGPRSRSQGKE